MGVRLLQQAWLAGREQLIEAFVTNLVGVPLWIRRRLSWWKRFCLLQRLVKWQAV